ncbi:aminotransferase class I/II-fold pyridoxal phosphate-dependent enzyme [Miniphocaeibacter halophilus]|uniref:Methionine gamma-lyase family protein n=1 Tax=Miniphocaeibacter halophilus TaxID=2931922 RepID=A0AC61MPS2_9FIRM|nr:methionine gamma-lyase family protein [Miniphocaeibacter halophilus]QQK07610.1 methionine gamma-lyase family protein [Miniphocaeibacter halophilus]
MANKGCYLIDNNINNKVYDFVIDIEESLKNRFDELNSIEEYNIIKIIQAMQDSRLSATDFAWSTGYGYGDIGREKVEEIYSKVFKTEDALVRPSISSGTHALALTLQGLLLPGDTLLSITGDPYDTLRQVIGIEGEEKGTLLEYGINYKKIELSKDGKIQKDLVLNSLDDNIKIITIQRSTGYSLRNAISIESIRNITKVIKEKNNNIIIMVDNCYGEFTQILEPTEVGADLAVGSLIKNPGGGIALSGGYVVGPTKHIERISNRLTAPGLGKETGLTFGTTRTTLQGLYFAPKVTMEALKGALLFARVFEKLGFKTFPNSNSTRYDIIEAIVFEREELVIDFCRTIQEASVVDAFVTPYPWEMPGYTDKVIMASGSFIDGSSIELSADGPLREPYIAYFQGGLNYYQCKYAVMLVLNKFLNKGYIKL